MIHIPMMKSSLVVIVGDIPVYNYATGIRTSTTGQVYYSSSDVNDICIIQAQYAGLNYFDDISGWTKIVEVNSSTRSFVFYWRRLDGTEAGYENVITSYSGYKFCTMVTFRGCKTSGVPYEALTKIAVTTASSTTIPSLAPSNINRLAVTFVSIGDNVGFSSVTNYTNRYHFETTSGNDASHTCVTFDDYDASDTPVSLVSHRVADFRYAISFLLLPTAT